MEIQVSSNPILGNWLSQIGMNESVVDVDEKVYNQLIKECARLHPNYTSEQIEAWSVYSILNRNSEPKPNTDVELFQALLDETKLMHSDIVKQLAGLKQAPPPKSSSHTTPLYMIGIVAVVWLLLSVFGRAQQVSISNVVPYNSTDVIDANGEIVSITLGGYGTAGFQIAGTWAGTLQFETTLDGSTWTALDVFPTTGTTAITSTTANGIWTGTVGGLAQIRVRASAWSSGSSTILIRITTVSAKKGSTAGGAADTFGTIGTATADNSTDTLPITDSARIDFTTTNDPEDLTADIVADSLTSTHVDESSTFDWVSLHTFNSVADH